jgi:hypothetical protein
VNLNYGLRRVLLHGDQIEMRWCYLADVDFISNTMSIGTGDGDGFSGVEQFLAGSHTCP